MGKTDDIRRRSARAAAALVTALSLVWCAVACGSGSAARRADDPPAGPASDGAGVPSAPSAGPSVPDLLAEARAAVEQTRYDQAERALLEATGLRPADAEAQYLLGVVRARTGNLDGALAALARASAEEPESWAPFELLVRLHVRRGDPGAAERVVDRRLAVEPDDIRLLALRLWVWLQQGRAREVIEASRELLRKDETNLRIMVHLARAYLQLRQLELAEYVLQTASKVREDAGVHHGLAEVAVARGEMKTALYHLRKVVELDPEAIEALNNLGVLYHWAGDDAAAVEVLQRAVALAPTFAEAFVNLGNAFRRQRSYAEAEASYRRAAEIAPDMPEAHYNLGILYFEQESADGVPDEKRFQQALVSFNRYKTLAGAGMSADDPVDTFIAEARRMIEEIERSRSEEPEPMEDEDSEDTGEGDEPGRDEDAGGEDEEASPDETDEPPAVESPAPDEALPPTPGEEPVDDAGEPDARDDEAPTAPAVPPAARPVDTRDGEGT